MPSFVHRLAAAVIVAAGLAVSPASAEILLRWDHNEIPPADALGIETIVVPAGNAALVRHAQSRGYRVWIEVEPSALAGFTLPADGLAGIVVSGDIPPKQRLQIEQQLKSPGARVRTVTARGKWPHIRTNWVVKSGEVLQVSSRSAQPWIENNAARIRIAGTGQGEAPLLTYPWQPITLADADEGPAVENYLVAIAEAGSFGADLLLPLHPRFQRSLALGQPQARSDWLEIRRYAAFYAWDLPRPYAPVANVGVVTSDTGAWFEVMNLLLRHNVPFALLQGADWAGRDLSAFDLLIVLDRLSASHGEALAQFVRQGGTLFVDRRAAAIADAPALSGGQATTKSADRITYQLGAGRVIETLQGIADPNPFALEVRQALGRERRAIDIWNGITVLAAPYEHAEQGSRLLTVLNYAHQPQSLQIRVRGTYAVVHYESPEEPLTLLPNEHRDGCTEFTLPALRIGARVFLSEATK